MQGGALNEMYSQDMEEEIVLSVFGDFVGRFLDIGAYDGITLSNTYELLRRGWSGIAVEPSPRSAFEWIRNLGSNDRVKLVLAACYPSNGWVRFLECSDSSVSTSVPEHKEIWSGAGSYAPIEVLGITPRKICDRFGSFDFVSIDAEGISEDILMEYPIEDMAPRLFCVETDGGLSMDRMESYLRDRGFVGFWRTPNNLLAMRGDPISFV